MLECLADLDERLGGLLVIRRGAPERELPALVGEAKANEVHFSADSGPFARRRIERVRRALAEAGGRVLRPLEQEVEEPLPGGESAARERLPRGKGPDPEPVVDRREARAEAFARYGG